MKSKKRVIWFLLMIAVMVVIFIFSNQSGEKSHAISNAVAEKVNIETQYDWQESSTIPLFWGLGLRKWAHIELYAVLGLTAIKWTCLWWKAGLICYGYACLDELHQLLVGSRGASITDTFLDAIGFGIVILGWLVVVCIKKRGMTL